MVRNPAEANVVHAESRFWRSRCAAEIQHPFSPDAPAEREGAAHRGLGPRSNTGQKGALVDYLTIVFPESVLEERGVTNLRHLLGQVFDFRGNEVVCTPLREKRWQFYTLTAFIVDAEGELVGRIGCGGNGSTVCVSLSGAGTRWVKHWDRTRLAIQALRGRITRCDLAFDDYEGKIFDVRDMRERARNREFCQGGTPPSWRFIDGEGNNKGSTLYVGTKGHKELCIYDKGMQLGLVDSPWVRCEVRLYGKHADIPLDVLTDPLAFLRGAYDVLELLLAEVSRDACTRLKTTHRQVEATGKAMVRYLRRQIGPSLNLLLEAFGGSFSDFVEQRIVREGSPGRFRGTAKGERLARLLREELCRAA